jgi:hypothetical protein
MIFDKNHPMRKGKYNRAHPRRDSVKEDKLRYTARREELPDEREQIREALWEMRIDNCVKGLE